MNMERDRLVNILTFSKVPYPVAADAIVIIGGVRSPITKAKRGGLKALKADELLAAVLRELLLKIKIRDNFISDIAVGNVLQPGAGAMMSRMAMFEAGFSEAISVYSINRQCASGLQAIASIAASIENGTYDCGIAAGNITLTLPLTLC
jgi:acetyl-CoA acyltransferase 1